MATRQAEQKSEQGARRFLGWSRKNRTSLSIAAFGAAAAMLVACSLGEGVTPDCDPLAPANSEGACVETSVCDAGNGIVKAEDGCCAAVGTYLYGTCIGETLQGSFRDVCTGATTDSGCCANSDSAYKVCMEGRYPVAPKETSSASAGGATAAATTAGGGS